MLPRFISHLAAALLTIGVSAHAVDSTVASGNLLTNLNASFEAGLRGGGLTGRPWVYAPPRFAQIGTDGKRSLVIGPGENFVTTMVGVTPGKRYQWSFDLRALDGAAATVTALCGTAFVAKGPKGGLQNPVYGQQVINATPEWKRHAVGINVPADSIPWAYLRIQSPQAQKLVSVMVDALRLCEVGADVSKPLVYVAPWPVEASLSTPDSTFSIFDRPGPIRIELSLSGSATASLSVRDVLYGDERRAELQRTQTGFAATLDLPVGMYQADAAVKTDRGEFHVYRTITVADHRPLRPHRFNPLVGHFPVGNLEIERARWLGFGGLRHMHANVNWNTVAPKPHEFVFPADADIVRARDSGLDLLVTLGYPVKEPPRWLNAVAASPGQWGWQRLIPKPQDMHHWKEYVRAMAGHYRGWVKNWEIINEPNGVMQPKEYVLMLQAAYEAIKEVDPQMKAVGLCSTWDYRVNGFAFVEECLKLGAGKYLDVISLHPYTWPKSAEERGIERMLQTVCKLRDAHAPHAKLWITEWSYVSPVLEPGRPITQRGVDIADSFGNTPVQVAAYGVRSALVHLAGGCDLTSVLDAITQGREHGHAPYRGAGMTWVDYDNTVLPAYLAWHEMSRHVVGAEWERPLKLPEKFRGLLWKTPDGRKELIAWRLDEAKTELAPVHASLEARDLFGRRITGPLQFSGNPIYISGPAAETDGFADQLQRQLEEQTR
ncbi:MAG: hypothetical protein HZA91_13575 [Verrucomicrobia bacterium]|nr:hypothetical protein [Verrucomicrobiota bacterium]